MSLRLRLVLALAAVAVPLIAVLTWARGALDYQSEVDSLHRWVAARMVDGRATCEADPERFPMPPERLGPRERSGPPGGPRDRRGERGPRPRPPRDGERRPEPPGDGDGRRDRPRGEDDLRPRTREGGAPIELFAYGPDFVSDNPRAPTFPADLRERLETGSTKTDQRVRTPGGSGVRVAARMPWGEGPCAVVMATRVGPGPRWLTRNQLITASLLALGLTAAVFLAAGPVVTRVRRLTQEVRAAARERYAKPVTVAGSDEISQLAHEFNEAGAQVRQQFEAVEERERALRTFVANTTHDVMIPMTVLQGHLSALRESDSVEPAILHDAMEEVQYMTSLLQNLSASAKLEAGQPELERAEVDLGALVERVVARHSPIGRHKGIELNVALPETPVVVQADWTLLEQAVSNLVHNAVRYGKPGGHVALLLDGAGGGADWRLRILDDGPGIDDELLSRLTERSFRGGDARTRHPEGQGLGLHIAFEVARRHGFALELRRSEFGGLEVELGSAS